MTTFSVSSVKSKLMITTDKDSHAPASKITQARKKQIKQGL